MKVLVIAAHPDDEALGCGGTIARHAAAGDSVDVAFFTDGVGSRADGDAALRNHHAGKASEILGFRRMDFGLFADQQMDAVPLLNVVETLRAAVFTCRPDIVYTHHGGDLNLDHRIVHQATLTALRPMPGFPVSAIYAYEVPSSTEWASDTLPAFRPNHFVDVSGFMDQKLAALQAYEEEMRPFPHPRSIEAVKALAAWRGASVGLHAAEAFMTVRSIQA